MRDCFVFIFLQEFAENLLNSGVHGAVMVLDPTFNTETMATALGIPSNKHMVRRHLIEEMKNLIGPARSEGKGRLKRARFVEMCLVCNCLSVSYRAEAKQDFERLSLGTPPTPIRQSSPNRQHSSGGRHTDEEGSLRRRAVKVQTLQEVLDLRAHYSGTK